MTVEELLEIEAIKDLRARYAHYYDSRQIDALVDLFTEDAICQFGPGVGGDWVGKEQIRERYQGIVDNVGIDFGVMHAATNPWIRIHDTKIAQGRWYLLQFRMHQDDKSPLDMFAIYDDVYKKQDGEWRIFRTRLDFLWPRRNFHGPREI